MDRRLFCVFEGPLFFPGGALKATRDGCLVLQQALNLDIQIRLLGAQPLRPHHRDAIVSMIESCSNWLFIAAAFCFKETFMERGDGR